MTTAAGRPWQPGNAVAVAVLSLLVVAFATRAPALLAAYALAAVALVVAGMRSLSALAGRELLVATLLATAILLVLPVAMVRNVNVAFHAITVALSFAAAYVLTRNLPAYVLASRITLLAAQAYVVAYLARSGLEDFPLENMLPDSSSNGVTSYLVVLQANACAGAYLLRRRTGVLSALVTLAICIVGYGRGSILAAAAIVAVCALFGAAGGSRLRALLGVLLVTAASAGVYLAFQDEIDTFVQVNTKIGSGLDDEPRQEIIGDYLGKIDGAGPLLLGADYRGTSVETAYYGNPHNSYIRAHNIFGLPYLLVMLAWPLLLDRRHWPGARRLFVHLMLALVLARSFTEPLLFPTFFDLYYFALCFALARREGADRPVPGGSPGLVRA
jgi:hypothetical protein